MSLKAVAIQMDEKAGSLHFRLSDGTRSKDYAVDDVLTAPLFWLRSIEREPWGSKLASREAYRMGKEWNDARYQNRVGKIRPQDYAN